MPLWRIVPVAGRDPAKLSGMVVGVTELKRASGKSRQ